MPRAPKQRNEQKPAEKAKAIVYVRVSTQEQRDEGYSIEAQLATLAQYCTAKGIEVVDVIQESETAKSSGRPGFARILQLIKSGEVNTVVVEKTDRLYRNMRDRVLLDDLGPTIHLVKESTVLSPTSKSHEKFIHDIKLVVAKNYIDNLCEEVAKGMTEKAKSGHWPTHVPTGYMNVTRAGRNVIEPDPESCELVAYIFNLYVTGDYSFKQLAAVAKKIGLKTRTGKSHGASGMQAMLRNPLYGGVVRWNGVDYPGLHDPLVTPAVWAQAQSVMLGRNSTKVCRTQSGEFIYRGLVRCAECDCLMSPYKVRKKSGREFIYYACSGSKGCRRLNVREESISEQFAAMLENLQLSGQALRLVRQALQESFGTIETEDTRTRELLNARKVKIEKSLEALYLDKLAGDVDNKMFLSVKLKLNADLADANADITRADQAKHATWEQTADFIETVSNSRKRFLESDGPTKRVMFQSATSNSWISEKILTVEPQFWFKTLCSAGERTGENPSENEVRTVWLPTVDSNHD